MDCTFLSENRIIWHSRALRLATSHAVHLTFSNADEQQETGTHMQECKASTFHASAEGAALCRQRGLASSILDPHIRPKTLSP